MEYTFIRIPLQRGILYSEPASDYREVVKEKSEEGWELVQIFAPSIAGEGTASYFEVIMKRGQSPAMPATDWQAAP